jgi:bifunctional UDP-N-acetylglucosamine pyrophosphorylase/glucosamine-1-phosphate N-acetyltransferase
MLPVAGRPILEWNLRALAACGFRKAVIVVGYMREEIEGYFGGRYGKLKMEYVVQEKQLGTGNAILSAEKNVSGSFLAMNGDILISTETIRELVSDVKKHKPKASIALVEVDKPSEYGVVSVKGNLVSDIEEKPEKPKGNLVNAGVYTFSRGIFDIIRNLKTSERDEYEITDALRALMPSGGVYGFKCRGMWMDIGLPWHLLDANEILMKTMKMKPERKAIIEKYAVVKDNVHVGGNTVVRSGSYIEGPSYIGENCVIGPNCYIRPYTFIQDGCHIGNAVEVKNSIIMSNTKIGHLSYIGDSIIGRNCNFGAGTTVANLRFDNDGILIEVKGVLRDSGRRKFGCLMGDNVKTGINVSIMPGRSIYPNAVIEPMTTVKNTIYTE